MSDEERKRKGAATLALEIGDKERAERLERERLASAERTAAIAADAARDAATIAAWQRVVWLLVLVLLVLTAGIVGVGVTGSIPGVGELHVTKEGAAP